jgi:hypothetical protein
VTYRTLLFLAALVAAGCAVPPPYPARHRVIIGDDVHEVVDYTYDEHTLRYRGTDGKWTTIHYPGSWRVEEK